MFIFWSVLFLPTGLRLLRVPLRLEPQRQEADVPEARINAVLQPLHAGIGSKMFYASP